MKVGVKLEGGRATSFEVLAEGKTVHSKLESLVFPVTGEVIQKVNMHCCWFLLVYLLEPAILTCSAVNLRSHGHRSPSCWKTQYL